MKGPQVPKVSIVIPCFNAGVLLRRSLESAIAQSFSRWELIVVDDGSTDAPEKVVADFADARIRILRQPNRGVSAARNSGVAQAKGALIAFLDADDTWAPQCVERLVLALEEKRNAVLAYCGWQNLGLEGGRAVPYIPPEYEATDKPEALLTVCPWPIHAVLTRTDAVRAAGCFGESLTNSEDYALWLEIATAAPIVRVPEVLAYYHHHSGAQASRNRVRAAIDTWLVKRAFVAKHPDRVATVSAGRLKELVEADLLRQAYVCHWDRDIEASRSLFRFASRHGLLRHGDWKCALPSYLPPGLHRAILRFADWIGYDVSNARH